MSIPACVCKPWPQIGQGYTANKSHASIFFNIKKIQYQWLLPSFLTTFKMEYWASVPARASHFLHYSFHTEKFHTKWDGENGKFAHSLRSTHVEPHLPSESGLLALNPPSTEVCHVVSLMFPLKAGRGGGGCESKACCFLVLLDLWFCGKPAAMAREHSDVPQGRVRVSHLHSFKDLTLEVEAIATHSPSLQWVTAAVPVSLSGTIQAWSPRGCTPNSPLTGTKIQQMTVSCLLGFVVTCYVNEGE